MGITDAFTGQPQKDAAETNKAAIGATNTNLLNANATARDQAGNLITTGYGNAAGNLGTGYGTATGAINAGAGSAINYLDSGTVGAMGQLGQARSDLTANGGAFKPLSDLAASYGNGAKLYADALGVNGATGNANATAAFQTGPGYDFTLSTGLDAINRAANARGQANSGNTDVDALKYGTGLANNTFQQWLSNLSPYNQLQLSATQGAATGNAGINQNLATLDTTGANILNTAGTNKAAIATGQGTSLADLARSYYGTLAGNDVGQGTALANNTTSANDKASAYTLNLLPQYTTQNKNEADAQTAGSANLLNFGMNAAKLAAGAAGGMPTGAGGGSSFLPSLNFLTSSGFGAP